MTSPATQSEFVRATASAFCQSGSVDAANKDIEEKSTVTRRIAPFDRRFMSAASRISPPNDPKQRELRSFASEYQKSWTPGTCARSTVRVSRVGIRNQTESV